MNPYQAGAQLGELAFGAPEDARGARSPGLVGLLTGRSGQPGAVYYQMLQRGASAMNSMQEAALNRSKAIISDQQAQARARYKENYKAQGYSDADAQFLADAAAGATSSNPNQIVATLPQMRAYQAASLGDDATANRMGAAYNGTPLKLSESRGGITTSNPYTNPDVAVNPLGDAAVLAHQAAAAASYASAARQRAGIGADKAANYAVETDADGNMVRVNKLTGDVSPLTQGDAPLKAAPKGGVNKRSAADAKMLDGFRQRIAQGKATPEQVAHFLVQKGRPDLAEKIFKPSYVVGYDDGSE